MYFYNVVLIVFLNKNIECSPTNGDPKLNDVNIINLAWVSELKILKEVLPHHEVPQPLNFEMVNIHLII